MKPAVGFTVKEIDLRSSDFLCEVVIENGSDTEIELTSITYDLPDGVRTNEAKNDSVVLLDKRYQDICERLSSQLTDYISLRGEEAIRETTNQVRTVLREMLTVRNILDAYLNMLMLRRPVFIERASKRLFAIRVETAEEAREAASRFDIKADADFRARRIHFDLHLLSALDQTDVARKSYVTIQPKSRQRISYIFSVRRNWFSNRSYAIPFNILTKVGNTQSLSTESATLSVSPNAITLSLLATLSSFIGSLVNCLSKARAVLADAKGQYAAPGGSDGLTADHFVSLSAGRQIDIILNSLNYIDITMGVLSSLILFNIYDMTAIKNQINYSYGWRVAIVLGFLCGFLNEKILTAFTALLK